MSDFGSPSITCSEDSHSKPECPPVHVSNWCKKQYELLKSPETKKLTSPVMQPSGKEILFVGEEHGDEQAYSFYEKLLRDPTAGFDCLFIELPTVFQKNFEAKGGIVHSSGVFERIGQGQATEMSKIELKDRGYIQLLESLKKVADAKKAKIILVDSSAKAVFADLSASEQVVRRNQDMAKNIVEKFSHYQCQRGLSIQGNAHLFTRNETSGLIPIDDLVKSEAAKLPMKDKFAVKKAFVYSPTSKNFRDAMGPCSWLNVLPDDVESYFDGKEFFLEHDVFPEKISTAFGQTHGKVEKEVDYVVVLPAQVDKTYLLKVLNEGRSKPKKFSSQHTVTIESREVDLELRTNSWSLNVSNAQSGLYGVCSNKCQDMRSTLIVTDVTYDKPTLDCQSFHPSWTNGHNFAPIYKQNSRISGECYCSK